MSTPDLDENKPDVGHENPELDEKRMSLIEHLDELRRHLRNAGIAFILALIAAFVFVKEEFEVLTLPVRQGLADAGYKISFISTEPSEGFWVAFKLAIAFAVIIAAPLIFWELWKFVAPGLYKRERRVVLIVTGATAVCFMGGATFGHLVLTRPAIAYLAGYLRSFDASLTGHAFEITPTYTLDATVGFMVMMLLGCGLAFELPVVLSALGWIGLVSARGLWKFNRFALVLAALLGGVLTPGADVVSQLLLAGPIFALYNLSIVVVKIIERGRKRKQDELESQYEHSATTKDLATSPSASTTNEIAPPN